MARHCDRFPRVVGDRLDAAFWIVEQAACGRATASDFIKGYMRYHMSENHADLSERDGRLERFVSIIERYNAGHSLEAGKVLKDTMSDSEADAILRRFERVQGLKGLPRLKDLLAPAATHTDPEDRGYKSPYAFWDDAGLHLEYPGPDWKG